MIRYRTRHTVVEAVTWNGPNDTKMVKNFIGDGKNISDSDDGNLKFCTYDGEMRIFFAAPGDYIVKIADKNFYIFKPDVFNNLFSAVHKNADERGIRAGDLEIYIGTKDGRLAPCDNILLNEKSIPVLNVDNPFSLHVVKAGMPVEVYIKLYAARFVNNWKDKNNVTIQ